jgi:hypothetical protein
MSAAHDVAKVSKPYGDAILVRRLTHAIARGASTAPSDELTMNRRWARAMQSGPAGECRKHQDTDSATAEYFSC